MRTFTASLGSGLVVAAAASAVAVAAQRALAFHAIDWFVAPVAFGAAAVVYAGARAAAAMRDRFAALVELDTTLGLHNKLSNALSLAERSGARTGFVPLAIAEGERTAERIRPRQAIAVRFGRAYVAWPVLAAATVSAGFFMPELDLLGREAERVSLQRTAQRVQSASESIERLNEQLRELDDQAAADDEGAGDDATAGDAAAPDGPARDILSDEDRELLDRLRQEVESGARTPDEARAEAARIAEEASERLRERAESAELEQRRIEQSMREAAERAAERQQDRADDSEASRLAERLQDAMQRGDLGEALDAMNDIERSLDELPPEQRDQLRDELDQLEQAMEQAADRAAEQRADAERRVREDLAREGLTPPESGAGRRGCGRRRSAAAERA